MKRRFKEGAKNCRVCKHWDEVSEKIRVRELLEETIQKFETKIKQKDYEPTVAEYLKLLQLEREIGKDDDTREIRVTWVDPTATSDTEKSNTTP